MNLTPYVATLRNELANAADLGGPDARALAERLTAPMESAVRLALLDALAAAADEITRDLAPGSVQMRLRDREPSFIVTVPPPDDIPLAAAGTRHAGCRTTRARSPGSTCDCPISSRAGSKRPPPATACPSTPGWSGPPPRRCSPSRRPPSAPRSAASASPAGSANHPLLDHTYP